MPTEEEAPAADADDAQETAEVDSVDEGKTEDATAEESMQGVDIFGDDAPEGIKAYDGNEDDFSIKPEELAKLDPAAMHVLSNFRRAFHRKSQELASERGELKGIRDQLDERSVTMKTATQELIDNRAKLLAMAQKLQPLAKAPELELGQEAPDRFTDEGQDYYLKQAFAVEMQKFLQGWQSLSEEETKTLETQKAELDKQARVQELRVYVESHTDFNEYLDDIKGLRQESNYHLTAERAYEIAKAMRERANAPSKIEQAKRAARKAVARPTLAGRRTTELMPPQEIRGGAARAAWFEEHPEASAELYRRIQRGGM